MKQNLKKKKTIKKTELTIPEKLVLYLRLLIRECCSDVQSSVFDKFYFNFLIQYKNINHRHLDIISIILEDFAGSTLKLHNYL